MARTDSLPSLFSQFFSSLLISRFVSFFFLPRVLFLSNFFILLLYNELSMPVYIFFLHLYLCVCVSSLLFSISSISFWMLYIPLQFCITTVIVSSSLFLSVLCRYFQFLIWPRSFYSSLFFCHWLRLLFCFFVFCRAKKSN